MTFLRDETTTRVADEKIGIDVYEHTFDDITFSCIPFRGSRTRARQ